MRMLTRCARRYLMYLPSTNCTSAPFSYRTLYVPLGCTRVTVPGYQTGLCAMDSMTALTGKVSPSSKLGRGVRSREGLNSASRALNRQSLKIILFGSLNLSSPRVSILIVLLITRTLLRIFSTVWFFFLATTTLSPLNRFLRLFEEAKVGRFMKLPCLALILLRSPPSPPIIFAMEGRRFSAPDSASFVTSLMFDTRSEYAGSVPLS
mmetsp:Transcript_4281/g.8924  ORF Transcript_4281/g.8924 Transcript_4281/m.8924 type:complete len:207 (+) Transcript_4281:1082-1702(+)